MRFTYFTKVWMEMNRGQCFSFSIIRSAIRSVLFFLNKATQLLFQIKTDHYRPEKSSFASYLWSEVRERTVDKGQILEVLWTSKRNIHTYIYILYLSSKFSVAVELISSRKKLKWNKNMLSYNFNIIYKLYTTKS